MSMPFISPLSHGMIVADREDGPCRREDHEVSKRSREAFEARTRDRYEWNGALCGLCCRCSSTLAIELNEQEAAE